jgi:predicted SAM-dependent methyltransferase
VNLGCGANVRGGFANIDYDWRPGVICWDLVCGIPFSSESMKGVYTEHCLEHFSIERGYDVLKEIYRILMPSGRARIVVPDGELYLRKYIDSAKYGRFPYQDSDGMGGIYTRMMSVNRIFYVQREKPYGRVCHP